ncbi:MAG: transketolase [Alphaproteobacteria bacterium]|nr:transketolase [Alphaproteobacteria bacterium]
MRVFAPSRRRKTPLNRIDKLAIDTIRTLSMDAVEKANSGHPGTPMALAPVIYTLFMRHMRYDPADARWQNRDRFLLSAGHASMLLYSMLFLANVREPDGEGLTLDDIKNFRQIDSRTPGHPEYWHTPGVEVTTGPLGQGCGMSVGMAAAARWKAHHFNRDGLELFNYRVFAICSDGDMMEGVSNEAASLAGHWKLSNLCWIYDQNHISIEGDTQLAFTENVAERFAAYGWNVQHVADANDTGALSRALSVFEDTKQGPTLIIVRSHIGYGAPEKQDTATAHGEPLGEKDIRGAKKAYDWPLEPTFLVPDGVREHVSGSLGKRGGELHAQWNALWERYQREQGDLAEQLDFMRFRELPPGWAKDIPSFPADEKGQATREAGGQVLNAIAANMPWLAGGAADLAPSTKTLIKNKDAFEAESTGCNFHFGIREHAMGCIVNGMTMSDLRSYGATFLIFSDYMKPAVRIAALSHIPSIWVYTHDSIGLGEDGPTHQPIEQLMTLRATPNMLVIRPCDANETAEAWRVAMEQKDRPVCFALSRQKLPTLDRNKYNPADGLSRGAYILSDPPEGKVDVVLIGTGSEVPLCLQAQAALAKENIGARVVSMPCWELFEAQDEKYRNAVLPPDILARVSVEAGATLGWERYVGLTGATIGMHSFGASGPYTDVYKKFGITAAAVAEAARGQVAKARA